MAQATSAMSADSEGGQLFSDKADVVRNERGGPSARHGGRRFVLLRRRHSRHWWRCALKNCPSKLITDEYGDEHLVFKTAEHNEEEHAKATRGRRRSEAVYRNQPVQQIGDYRYVEEPSDGNDRCWRCEFVSCPGRCRTDRDLRVTAGPTQHLQEVHTKRDQPFAAQDGDGAPPPEKRGQLLDSEAIRQDARDVSNGSRVLLSQHRQGQRQGEIYDEVRDEQQGEEYHGILPEVILEESSSQECDAPAGANGTSAADSSTQATCAPSAEHAGRDNASRTSSFLRSADQRARPLKEHATNSTVEDANPIDLTQYEDSSVDGTEDDHSATYTECRFSGAAEMQSSRMDSAGGAVGNAASARRTVSFAEALNSISGTCCEQRRRIQDQVSEVLRLEAKLLRQQLRNEVQRAELLERQLREHVPRREPHMSPSA